MYQLWGGGAPFRTTDDPDTLRDSKGQSVSLCGNTRDILSGLQAARATGDAKVAYVSCTDEPAWADECLRLFRLGGDGDDAATTLKACADIEEIYKANKKQHFQRLQKKTGLPFNSMIFFDNEKHNCTSVSQLGVVCVHCRRGLSAEVWEEGLAKFAAAHE